MPPPPSARVEARPWCHHKATRGGDSSVGQDDPMGIIIGIPGSPDKVIGKHLGAHPQRLQHIGADLEQQLRVLSVALGGWIPAVIRPEFQQHWDREGAKSLPWLGAFPMARPALGEAFGQAFRLVRLGRFRCSQLFPREEGRLWNALAFPGCCHRKLTARAPKTPRIQPKTTGIH